MLGAIDSTWWVQPVSLTNRHVSLAPLQVEHAAALGRAASDGELWRMFYTSVPTPDSAHDYVVQALQQQTNGWSVPFVVRDAALRQKIRSCTKESPRISLRFSMT